MGTRELIKAEIDRVEDESLDELYGLVRRFTNVGPVRSDVGPTTGRGRRVAEPASPLFVGSPRLVHRVQIADFEKEVVESRDAAVL